MRNDERQLVGQAYRSVQARDFAGARTALQVLLRDAPDNVNARLFLSNVLLDLHDLRGATEQLLVAARHPPDDATTRAKLARYLYTAGETVAARACLAEPIKGEATASGLFDLGFVYQMMGETRPALSMLQSALDAGLDTSSVHYFLGLAHEFDGDRVAARRHYEACLQREPTHGRAALQIARLQRVTPRTAQVDRIKSALRRAQGNSIDQAALQFALYKEKEDLGEYADAWSALKDANAIMGKRNPHDAAGKKDRELDDSIVRLCTREFVSGTDRVIDKTVSAPMPIFIIGLPRSGTTLLERMLGNHSGITPSGELMEFLRQLRWMTNIHGHNVVDTAVVERAARVDFRQLGERYLKQTQWRAMGSRFYTDKLPTNFQIAGLIHKALPNAPILHMVREPIQVCFSNFRAMFNDACAYSYNLQSLATYHHEYRRLMRHWHAVMPGCVHDVSYTDLVRRPRETMQAVLSFCGLPFEAGCVDTTHGSMPVSTLSSSQVRQGIHDRGLSDWEHYAEQLKTLRGALYKEHGSEFEEVP